MPGWIAAGVGAGGAAVEAAEVAAEGAAIGGLVVAVVAVAAALDALGAWVFGILYAPAGRPVAFCQKFLAKSSVACGGIKTV